LPKLLSAAKELLADDEIDELEAEMPEPSPPQPGQITLAHQACQAAEVEVGKSQNLTDVAQARLRELERQRPPTPTDPEQVEDAVDAQWQHDVELHKLQEIVAAHAKILAGLQAQRLALKGDLQKLHERERYLRATVMPSLRRQTTETRQRRELREQELENFIAIARREEVALEHAIEATVSELQQLTGEQAR
jgi:hypothetical protein